MFVPLRLFCESARGWLAVDDFLAKVFFVHSLW
jgi:hypothetical protein